MQDSKVITVVILCYRNFGGIEDTIRQIAEQSYRNIELIISDDCSDDFEAAYMEQLAEPYKNRFTAIIVNKNEKNMGTVKHINHLFDLAHGDLFFYQGCDDLLYDKEVIQDVVNEFEKTDADIITTKRAVVMKDGTQKQLPEEKEIAAMQRGREYLLKYICRKGNIISGCGTFYQKKVFDKYGKFDETYRLMEDFPYYLNYMQRGGTIHFMNRTSMKYAWGGNSTSLNPVVEKDKKILLSELYMPNRNMYGLYDRRLILFRHKREKEYHGKIKALLALQFPEIVLCQSVAMMTAKVKRTILNRRIGDSLCK